MKSERIRHFELLELVVDERVQCSRVAIRGKQPGNGALHAISQLVGIELRCFAGFTLTTGLIGESAEGIPRVGELLCPAVLIVQFVEKPLRDAVLLIGRECRDPGYGRVQGSSHDMNYTRLSLQEAAVKWLYKMAATVFS